MKIRTALNILGILLAAIVAVYCFKQRRVAPPPVPNEAAWPAAGETPTSPRQFTRLLANAPAGGNVADTEASSVPFTNILQRIFDGDETLSRVSSEQLGAWLAQNKTNAESLLAAWQASGDTGFLRTALTNFPHDANVLLNVITRDLFPEAQRQLLDQFQTAAPDNALADYLSARNHLKNGQPQLAVQDLLVATQKPGFDEYTVEKIQSLEELCLSTGKPPAEAKALAMSGTHLPQLAPLKNLAQEMATLQKQYLAAGDGASAESLAYMGITLAERVGTQAGGRGLLNQLVGLAMERIVLSPLDQEKNYEFLQSTVPQRMASLDTQRKDIRESVQVFKRWLPAASEAEVIIYFDRLKLYGEAAALKWLDSRQSAQ